MVKKKTSKITKKSSKHKIELLKKITKLSKGDKKEREEAVELIIKNYQSIEPKKYTSLLEKLASSKNSKKTKLKIGNFIIKQPVSFLTYRTLMRILVKDKDPEIISLTTKIIRNRISKISSTPLLTSSKSLENLTKLHNLPAMANVSKSLENIAKLQKSSTMLGVSKSLENIAKMGTIASIGLQKNQLSKLARSVDITPPKSMINAITLSDTVNRQLNSKVIKSFPSFYQPIELEVIEKPVKKPKKNKTQELIAKLKKCKPGKKYWKEFEDVCKEILEYCFCPPLDAPLYQEYTENRIHRRDIIFLISHGLGDYWQFLISTYGEGIIFDCKNYAKGIPENEIRITEKYLGSKKLTSFGIVISRKGFSKGAIDAQKEIWKDHGNMIISVTDEDLIKMLELKDSNGEPWKVIDYITKKFRLGL